MEDRELMAIQLGFESAEEMEAYHDLCRGMFKENVAMTKERCQSEVIGNGWENLITASKAERLEKKLEFDFGGLVESMRFEADETEQSIRNLINFELSELRKCYGIEDKKTIK